MKTFWQIIIFLSHLLIVPKSSGICMLFKSQPSMNVQQVCLLSPPDTLAGKVCLSSYPVTIIGPSELHSKRIFLLLSHTGWKKAWLSANPYLITNTVKEISCKRTHRLCPCKDYLKTTGKSRRNVCVRSVLGRFYCSWKWPDVSKLQTSVHFQEHPPTMHCAFLGENNRQWSARD